MRQYPDCIRCFALDGPEVVIANELIGPYAATIPKYPYQKIGYMNIASWVKAKIEARMA